MTCASSGGCPCVGSEPAPSPTPAFLQTGRACWAGARARSGPGSWAGSTCWGRWAAGWAGAGWWMAVAVHPPCWAPCCTPAPHHPRLPPCLHPAPRWASPLAWSGLWCATSSPSSTCSRALRRRPLPSPPRSSGPPTRVRVHAVACSSGHGGHDCTACAHAAGRRWQARIQRLCTRFVPLPAPPHTQNPSRSLHRAARLVQRDQREAAGLAEPHLGGVPRAGHPRHRHRCVVHREQREQRPAARGRDTSSGRREGGVMVQHWSWRPAHCAASASGCAAPLAGARRPAHRRHQAPAGVLGVWPP